MARFRESMSCRMPLATTEVHSWIPLLLMDHFNKIQLAVLVVSWLGPFYRPAQSPDNQGRRQTDRFRHLLKCSSVFEAFPVRFAESKRTCRAASALLTIV